MGNPGDDYDPPTDWSDSQIELVGYIPPTDWSDTEILLKEKKGANTSTVGSETRQHLHVDTNLDVSQSVSSSVVDVDSLTTTTANVQSPSLSVTDTYSVQTNIQSETEEEPIYKKAVSPIIDALTDKTQKSETKSISSSAPILTSEDSSTTVKVSVSDNQNKKIRAKVGVGVSKSSNHTTSAGITHRSTDQISVKSPIIAYSNETITSNWKQEEVGKIIAATV